MKNAMVKAVYGNSKAKDTPRIKRNNQEGGLKEAGPRNQADIYFNYFSERVQDR